MEIVLEIVTPVFAVLLMGYAARRIGWFSEESAAGLAKFVFNFAIPLFLFRTFATRELPDSIPWGLFGSYYIAVFAVYALGMVVGMAVFGRNLMGGTLTGMGCAFGNTVLLGIALGVRAFGEEGAIPLFLIISVHGLILMTGTTILLEAGRNAGSALRELPYKIVRGLVTNPLIGGLAFGLTFNLTGLELPTVADDFLRIMQGAVLPCALFAMGSTLAEYGFKGRLGQSIFVVLAKCLVMPGIVYVLATQVFDLEPLWAMAATLMAAQPTGVNVYLFAQRYGTAQAIASTTIFLSTAFSIFSLPLILYLFGK